MPFQHCTMLDSYTQWKSSSPHKPRQTNIKIFPWTKNRQFGWKKRESGKFTTRLHLDKKAKTDYIAPPPSLPPSLFLPLHSLSLSILVFSWTFLHNFLSSFVTRRGFSVEKKGQSFNSSTLKSLALVWHNGVLLAFQKCKLFRDFLSVELYIYADLKDVFCLKHSCL